MKITGTEDISIVREDLADSGSPLAGEKTIEFRHQASAGDLLISISSLVSPTEDLSNGFVQPSAVELSAARIFTNRRKLLVHSSRGAILKEHQDYKVVDNQTIRLIGNIAALGGALEGEVFSVTVQTTNTSGNVLVDSRNVTRTYVLGEGETELSLGQSFELGKNVTFSQIGAIKVSRKGIIQRRNVGNAPASVNEESGNYHEKADPGETISTLIEFNVPGHVGGEGVEVTFGTEFSGDVNLIDDINQVNGMVQAFIKDVAADVGREAGDYVIQSPTEADRASFGNKVMELSNQLAILNANYGRFEDSGIQILPTINWNAAVPAGTPEKFFRYIRRGQFVDLWMWFRYSGLAANNTFFFVDMLGLIPTSEKISPVQFTQDVVASGSGGWGNGGSILAPGSFHFQNNERIYSSRGSVAPVAEFVGHLKYITSDS